MAALLDDLNEGDVCLLYSFSLSFSFVFYYIFWYDFIISCLFVCDWTWYSFKRNRHKMKRHQRSRSSYSHDQLTCGNILHLTNYNRAINLNGRNEENGMSFTVSVHRTVWQEQWQSTSSRLKHAFYCVWWQRRWRQRWWKWFISNWFLEQIVIYMSVEDDRESHAHTSYYVVHDDETSWGNIPFIQFILCSNGEYEFVLVFVYMLPACWISDIGFAVLRAFVRCCAVIVGICLTSSLVRRNNFVFIFQ